MRQKLCRRLEELERISAAAARARMPSVDLRKLEELVARIRAGQDDPEHDAWLAAQPPDFLHHRVQKLRAQLMEKPYGHRRGVAA